MGNIVNKTVRKLNSRSLSTTLQSVSFTIFMWYLLLLDIVHIAYIWNLIDMMLKCPVLNMHTGLTNGKVQVYSDKQIPMDLDTIVSFVTQSGQVLEGGAISVSLLVNSTWTSQPWNIILLSFFSAKNKNKVEAFD